MGKSKRKERDRRREEIQSLASSRGLQVSVYNWGRHYRITGGEQAIDYWPGSGTCWVTGSMAKGIKMEPNEAIDLAIAKPLLPEGAEEHLKEIRSSAVAEGEIDGQIMPLGPGPLEPDPRAPSPTEPEAGTAHQPGQRDPGNVG